MRWVATLLLVFGPAASALADGRVGIVVMHGKWSNPGAVSGFASRLERAGHLVENLEMPWSGRRSYDAGVEAFVADVDAAVKRLKDKGAEKIVLAGHSMGTNGALHYASRRSVDGVIGIAPGHTPESPNFRNVTAGSISRAKDMVAKGEGGDKATFDDLNTGRTRQITLSAQVYLDYFDPDGPMNFTENVKKIPAGTPLLWVAATGETPGLKAFAARVFPLVPPSVPFTKMEVDSDHAGAPDKAGEPVLEWIARTIR